MSWEKGPKTIEVQAHDSYFFCTCGNSPKLPFCKKKHEGTGKGPKRVIFDETQSLQACCCGQSAHFPFCDNSHLTQD